MVFELIRGLLADSLGCDEADITMNADLFDDLGLSQSDLGDVMDALGEELGFSVAEADWTEVSTVGDLVAHVERLA